MCQIGVSDREGEMLCVSDRCQIDVREGMHYDVRVTQVSNTCQIGDAQVLCVSDRCVRWMT